MSKKLTMALVLLFIAVVPSSTATLQRRPMEWSERSAIVAMSFNLRTGMAFDGLNSWPFRIREVEYVLRQEEPDLIAVQEANQWQIDGIMRAVPGYSLLTGGSIDVWSGKPVILYRTDRFVARTAKRIWFSEASWIPNSTSWGNPQPRSFTAAELYDQFQDQELAFVSVHLDHQSANSRDKSIRQLADWVRQHKGRPLIVAGDFNEPADSTVLDLLRSADSFGRNGFGRLEDSYLLAHEPEKGTLHGFTGKATDRIDLILVSTDCSIIESHVVEHHNGSRFPSDHYPVVVTVALPSKGFDIAVHKPANH